jgi:hypothetical protein
MLALHLREVSLAYVNMLILQRVLAEPEWQPRLHCDLSQGAIAAEVITREPPWDLHAEHERGGPLGAGGAVCSTSLPTFQPSPG